MTHSKALKGVNVDVGQYKIELVKLQKKLDASNKECIKISEDKNKLKRLVESLRSKISILHTEGMSKKAAIDLEKLKVKKEVKEVGIQRYLQRHNQHIEFQNAKAKLAVEHMNTKFCYLQGVQGCQ